MEITKDLENLSAAFNAEAKEYTIKRLRETLDTVEERNGYILAYDKIAKGKKIILDAHIDAVRLVCTYITDDGLIKVGASGGFDVSLLFSQRVTAIGKTQTLNGVVCTVPVHLQDKNAEKNASKIDDIFIDFGFASKTEAEKELMLGTEIEYARHFSKMPNFQVMGQYFDDRAGVAAILYALENLKNSGEKSEFSPVVVISDLEEIGDVGAKIAALKFHKDIEYAIAIDVSFAYSHGESKEKYGLINAGAMIGVSPVLDKGLTNALIQIANAASLPSQIEVMPAMTSTNGDAYASAGIRTAVVSIPLKFMHSGFEIVSLKDIENCGKLISAFLKR